MRSGLLTLVCWVMLVWNALAQEQVDRAKYELIRETINLLATDKAVSQDTAFRISCEALDYDCFEQQLAGNPIAGIERWYNRWRSMAASDEAGLKALRDRIFADIFEREGKGYRKQLASYEGYVTRTANLIALPVENIPPEVAMDTVSERVPDHAVSQTIYPEQLTDQIDNPEKEDPMIAYLAIGIGLIALAIAALPFIRKNEPERPTDFDALEELHGRLDGIALRMKNLEQKITDPQAAETLTHLTDIMESVEKRVVDLESRVSR
ncbi:hypothetical protein [Parapedobacter sp. 10938]|uniref:hypothetical protein n=1 Tax=Parapedobacter flavus TaxID=3110225 RepID=UPI002DBE2938|nr:hypothetical protein [Parapedobacter sp. 10938]MEC3879628.1 hypothetical protein [Parapedobacter sp. 10938]